MTNRLSLLQCLIIAALGGLGTVSSAGVAVSQNAIVPDNTLGLESSQIHAVDAFTEHINGGAPRGTNLFHSFLEFNILDGHRVYFTPHADIENILGRVTGSNPSELFGTLGVEGGANLFLLNPNGITFGANANLDIEGSFFTSTAEELRFADDSKFSAVNPEDASLLTVKVPLGLQYGPSPSGATIENEGSLAAGQNLTLWADRLNLQGQLTAGSYLTLYATDSLRVRDTSTRPFVAAAGDDLLVQGDAGVDIFVLNHPDSGLLSGGDLRLRSANPVGGDAHYWSGGDFRVESIDGDVGNLFSPYDPIIRSFGDVFIDEYEGTSLHILAGGSVTIGAATITAPEQGTLGVDFLQETIELSDGTLIAVDGSAQPTLDIRAGVIPDAIGVPPLTTLTGFNGLLDNFSGNNFVRDNPSSADIDIGGVLITSPNGLVLLSNQYEANAALPTGNIVIADGDTFGTGIDVGGQGIGGAIYLDSRDNIFVFDGVITTTSFGEAGDIVLAADEAILFDGFITDPGSEAFGLGGVLSGVVLDQSVNPGGQPISAGDIKITANDLILSNGATLFTSAVNDGRSGDIVINVSGTVSFEGISPFGFGGALSGAFLEGPGSDDQAIASGNIQIKTDDLTLLNGASLNTSTINAGDAGEIIVDASGTVRFDGVALGLNNNSVASGAVSAVFSDNVAGVGGDIRISAANLEVTDGAQIASETLDVGNSGDIFLDVEETARFDTRAVVSSSVNTDAVGDGGDIRITAANLDVRNLSFLGAVTGGVGDAGNVILDIAETAQFDAFGLILTGVAEVGRGDGGDVNLSANTLLVTNGSQLNANTMGLGDAGNVIVNVAEVARFDNLGRASSSVDATAEGNGGDVRISAANLEVTNFAALFASVLGVGDAGNVTVNVSETASFDRAGSALTTIEQGGRGNGGDVQIFANNLDVINGGSLRATTDGVGDAGNVTVDVAETARFIGNLSLLDSSNPQVSSASSSVNENGEGQGGDVRILARNLEVTDGATLDAETLGVGDAGDVIITVTDIVRFDGADSFEIVDGDSVFVFPRPSGASSSVNLNAVGNGGDVRISSRGLEVANGARIEAQTLGVGDAGDVIISVGETARFDGAENAENLTVPSSSGASSNVGIAGQGMGGDVRISANNLEVLNGASLSSNNTLGTGDAGNVILTIEETARFDGFFSTASDIFPSQASTRVVFGSQGDGGNVRISANNLEITDGARLRADTSLSIGDAGSIVLTVDDQLFVRDGTIETIALAASGGGVVVDSDKIRLNGDSNIISFVQTGAGEGGDILLTASSILAFDDSDILAFAQDGRGGNIILNTPAFFGENYQPSPEGIDPFTLDGNDRVDINASGAISGIVTLPDVRFIQDSLVELPDNLVNTEELISSSCIVSNPGGGSLAVSGQDSSPEQPSADVIVPYGTGTVKPTLEKNAGYIAEVLNSEAFWQPDQPIVEPRGLFRLPDGRLVISRSCAD